MEEELAEVGEGKAGIEDVLDDENVLPLDGVVKVLDELDGAGGALALSVTGGGYKVECGVGLNGPCEIGEKRGRSLEDTDHHELFAVQVPGNLGAHRSEERRVGKECR